MQHILIVCITLYRRYISPFFPPTCRFYPTCSEYGIQAIRKYGAFKGSWMTLWRIMRCHPLSKGGYDPVK
ncbi:membrane protein insertion efficiency factor YidD [candidate division KSB3 bacterium]|uniref:Putative membrane protein insertion efficiency factor n=1 Tax=candidate division KSB3 bacterium TaxID=2044937 RepID=A0A2G6K9V7_9BACT|nr:MAG: membrane protein insertion efficiency factor YidD [candidate division KSB3 bacterium]